MCTRMPLLKIHVHVLMLHRVEYIIISMKNNTLLLCIFYNP